MMPGKADLKCKHVVAMFQQITLKSSSIILLQAKLLIAQFACRSDPGLFFSWLLLSTVAVCGFVSLQSVCYTQLFIAPQLFIPALTLWLWECPHWNRNWELCSDDLSLIFWTFYDDSRECHIILSLSYKSNCCDKQQK